MKKHSKIRMFATMAICFLGLFCLNNADTQSFAEEKKQLDELKKLRVQRIEILRKGSDYTFNLYKEGKATFRDTGRLHRDLVEAELDATEAATERVAILRNAIVEASKQVKVAQARFENGATSELDLLEAQAYRLHLEIQLIQALPPR